jgi:hypothetical protein
MARTAGIGACWCFEGGRDHLILITNKFLGSSLSKQEHTVINIGDPDGVPRLVRSDYQLQHVCEIGLLLIPFP